MVSLKYAVVERERRWLLAHLPRNLQGETFHIRDKYMTGTRLRLREVTYADGSVVRKLGHKVRLDEGPRAVACTSLYVDDDEWERLLVLPGTELVKRRTLVHLGEAYVAVDEFEGHLAGLVLAEIDGGDPVASLPAQWPVQAEVTTDEAFTGAALALSGAIPAHRLCSAAGLDRQDPDVP